MDVNAIVINVVFKYTRSASERNHWTPNPQNRNTIVENRSFSSFLRRAIQICHMANSTSSEEPQQVETVDLPVAKDLILSGYRYLDVRTVEEFGKGHVTGAINIPYFFFTPRGKEGNPKFMEMVLNNFSKDDNVVVGCASGARSIRASTELFNAGFKHVKNMKEGYAALVQSGLAGLSIHSDL